MATFTVNTHRLNPYSAFAFQVTFGGGAPVAGISKVSPLKMSCQVLKHRDGGAPLAAISWPGPKTMEPITMERGVTHDPEFEQWAAKVWRQGAGLGGRLSLADFRRDITLDLLNEAGQVAIRYSIFGCWVSEYTALGELDANGNGVAIQSLKLEHQGWARDLAQKEPREPVLEDRG